MHIGDKVIVIVSFISIHHLKWLHLFYTFKKNRKENLGNGNAFVSPVELYPLSWALS